MTLFSLLILYPVPISISAYLIIIYNNILCFVVDINKNTKNLSFVYLGRLSTLDKFVTVNLHMV